MIATFIENNDARGVIGIEGNELKVAFGEEIVTRDLSDKASRLAGFLIFNSNTPFIAYGIKRSEGLADLDVSGAYKDLRKNSKTTIVPEHLVSIGSGSATTYGLITSNSLDSRLQFAERAIKDIELDRLELGDRRTEKRLKPFLAYKKLIESGEDNKFFTRDKKIAGAGAAIITIGAATIYVTRHFKHE